MNNAKLNKMIKVIFLLAFMLVIDYWLLTILINGQLGIQFFLAIFFGFISNLFILAMVIRTLHVNEPKTRSIIDLTNLLDNMSFNEPISYESLIEEELTEVEVIEEAPLMNEQGEPLQILKPKTIKEQKPIFDAIIQPVSYTDALYNYCIDSGLAVDKNTIREMIAALATSKLLILNHEKREISLRFLELFTEFVGINHTVCEIESLKSFEELFSETYPFLQTITDAANTLNRFHFITLDRYDLNQMNILEPFIEYSLNPNLPFNIENKHNQAIKELTPNVWMVILPKTNQDEPLNEKHHEGVLQIELDAKLVMPKEVVSQNPFKLSFEQFTGLLYEGYDHHYIEESEWKKIDQVEQFTMSHGNYKIDNRLFRQLERFTSTFIQFGGEKSDAMDRVLYDKLLRIVLKLQLTKENEQEDLLTLFERLFGLENLNKSKNLLKTLNEDPQTAV